ncbi:MAG: DUF2189 domain-containing protein [Pseudomonadota bacterium]
MGEDQTGDKTLGAPAFRDVTRDILREALIRGLRDFRRAPVFGLVFAAIYIAIGWALAWVTAASGTSYWLILAVIGFPLIGPFAAIGLYEVSRRIQASQPTPWSSILGVIWGEAGRQLPWLCALIVVVFLFWFFVGHTIFALFLGLSPMTNVSSSYEVFATAAGLKMLTFGSVVGAGFALVLFMMSVLSLPMLLDREVDFITAMITSIGYVAGHLPVMLIWGMVLALLTFVALAPWFLGLFLVFPVLGHASWHLYDLLALRETGPVAAEVTA